MVRFETGVEHDLLKRSRVRVLVRQQQTGLYLQESGEWSDGRETAWEFGNPALAQRWVKQQKRLRLEVVLAFFDPRYDYVAMRT